MTTSFWLSMINFGSELFAKDQSHCSWRLLRGFLAGGFFALTYSSICSGELGRVNRFFFGGGAYFMEGFVQISFGAIHYIHKWYEICFQIIDYFFKWPKLTSTCLGLIHVLVEFPLQLEYFLSLSVFGCSIQSSHFIGKQHTPNDQIFVWVSIGNVNKIFLIVVCYLEFSMLRSHAYPVKAKFRLWCVCVLLHSSQIFQFHVQAQFLFAFTYLQTSLHGWLVSKAFSSSE